MINTDFDENITEIIEENNFTTKYKFKLNTGKGMMEFYHILPGIELIYNNFHSKDCNQLHNTITNHNILVINHCNKGRFECEINNKFIYLSEGDVVASLNHSKIFSEFPLKYYEGFELILDLNIAQKTINDFIGEGIIKLDNLITKLENNNGFSKILANNNIIHIINEIYNVNENIKKGYYKIKVIEFLLFLTNSQLKPQNNIEKLTNKQVEKIKKIHNFVMNNITEEYTLDDLSKLFNISKTSIKTHFKDIYGKSLNQIRKEYRLILALDYIKNTNHTIKEISNMVGYKNPSKFSNAFKTYYGKTPSSYRK